MKQFGSTIFTQPIIFGFKLSFEYLIQRTSIHISEKTILYTNVKYKTIRLNVTSIYSPKSNIQKYFQFQTFLQMKEKCERNGIIDLLCFSCFRRTPAQVSYKIATYLHYKTYSRNDSQVILNIKSYLITNSNYCTGSQNLPIPASNGGQDQSVLETTNTNQTELTPQSHVLTCLDTV